MIEEQPTNENRTLSTDEILKARGFMIERQTPAEVTPELDFSHIPCTVDRRRSARHVSLEETARDLAEAEQEAETMAEVLREAQRTFETLTSTRNGLVERQRTTPPTQETAHAEIASHLSTMSSQLQAAEERVRCAAEVYDQAKRKHRVARATHLQRTAYEEAIELDKEASVRDAELGEFLVEFRARCKAMSTRAEKADELLEESRKLVPGTHILSDVPERVRPLWASGFRHRLDLVTTQVAWALHFADPDRFGI
jgi:hypothetical protein